MRRKRRDEIRKPIEWQVRLLSPGQVWCVMAEHAPPLRPHEAIIWTGVANHFQDAMRSARASGCAIVLGCDGMYRLKG